MRTLITVFVMLFFSFYVQAEDKEAVTKKNLQTAPATFKAGNTATRSNIRPLQFKPMTAVQIKKAPLLKLKNLRPITPSAKTIKPEGPDPSAALDLSDYIDDPSLIEDMGVVCGWDSHLIIQDIAAPHVFYYIPREFLLKRDPDGFRLSIQYNTRSEQDKPSVMVTAELQAPHRPGDLMLLKSILQQAFDLKPADPLEIRAMPGIGSTADLNALATGLSLPSERINLSPPAHLKQVFRLTLSLTQDEAEEVLAQIAGDGLAGNLNIKAKDTYIPVAIRIGYRQFTGPMLEGFDNWAAGKSIDNLKNLTEFPVNIEAINAYRLKDGKLERISKNLKPVDIKPGETKPLKLPSVKQLLGEGLAVTWMGLSLDSNCTDCLKDIDLKVRKGVGLAPGSRIHLEAIPAVFEEFGIYKLIVHIQSPYLSVGGKTVQQEEAVLTADANENEDIMIFVPADKGTDPLLYKYRLETVLESGETRLSPAWEDSRKLTQFFGSSQLEALLDKPVE
ncbi:MAG: hypothetical protein JXL81_09030 [Deltaproteobacteria bacterium]|nr:hypothetical protein [Deltaproteobacteria bacterium]